MAVDPGRILGPVVIPNIVEMTLRWVLASGKIVHNVLHGIVAGGFSATATEAESIRFAITSGLAWTNYADKLNGATGLEGVDLRDLRGPNLPLVSSTGGAQTGTGAGKSLPAEVALVVTLRTAQAGRAFRGRVYLPGFDDTSMNADGTASAATITDTAAFVSHVQAAMSATGLALAIAQPARQAYTSPRTGAAIPARSAGSALVTGIVVRDGVFDSQRRRAR